MRSKTLTQFILAHRLSIICVTLLLVLLSAWGMRYLVFNDDTRIWFGERNPYLKAYVALENTYVKSDNVYFVLAPQRGTVFRREVLAAVADITRASWQLPFANRVDSINNYQHSYSRGDEFVVEDLVADVERLSEKDLAAIKQVALNEPTLRNRLISPVGDVTAVNVNIIRPSKDPDELARITAAANVIADDIRQRYPDIDLYLSGTIVFDHAIVEATRHDIETLLPLMFGLMIVVIYLLLRSLLGTLAIILVITLSTLSAMGIAGWLGINLNPASGNAPVVILTLAMADSVHILVTLFQKMREGMPKESAIMESMRINLRPVLLTSITTAIGFLSMNYSDAPPFHDLGNIVAIGVIIALILSVVFLPALMAVLPLRIAKKNPLVTLSYDRLAAFVVAKRKMLLTGAIGFSLLLSTGISRIELDDNFIEYMDESFAARRAAEFIQSRLSGFDVIEYSLEAGEPGGISDPRYLARVEEFANWYRQQSGVVHVTSFTDIIKRLNRNMHNDAEEYYRLPDRRELAAQYLLLYEMSLPYGLDLNNRINVDKSASRLSVIIRGKSSRELRQLDQRAQQWLRKHTPDYMHTAGTGLSIMFSHISRININTMLLASLFALVLISALLMLALHSVKIGFASLVPNLMPAFAAFGLWGIFIGQVGLAAAVIVALTLGIVVDDTIHFISNYLVARQQERQPPAEAVRRAFNHVATALWSTTLILVVGFGVLVFSGYKVTSEMGLLTVITISLALLLDFLLLPALLVVIERKKAVTAGD